MSLTSQQIHIGRHNVIGEQFIRAGVETITHDQIGETLKAYKIVSISAFDPVGKTDERFSMNHLYELTKYIERDASIIYYSTLRILNYQKEYQNYTQNKLCEEKYLRDNFKNVHICYLPNLVSNSDKFKSRFWNLVRENYRRNVIYFDLDYKSEFNFVFASEIVNKVKSVLMHSNSCIVSKNNISLYDLVKELASMKPDISIFIGEKTSVYPRNLPDNVIYTEYNTGKYFDWLRGQL